MSSEERLLEPSESPTDNQPLESFILAQFQSLKLDVPADDVEYIARLVEEEDLPEEDKKEGVKGMMEGFIMDSTPEPQAMDDAVDAMISHWQALQLSKADDQERDAADAEEDAGDGEDGEAESSGEEEEGEVKGARAARKKLLASLTPEELAAAQKRALLRQYGYVEDTTEDPSLSDPTAPPRGLTLLAREQEKAKAERQNLIHQALLLEGKRAKRKAKQSNRPIDLMAPNLNKEKVQAKAQMMREGARKEAGEKRDRDKLALEKQREGEKRKLEEKRKKAQKGERRA